MATMTRRNFMKAGAALAALMGLGASAVPTLARALEKLSAGNPPVLWLQGQSCSGCSVSLINTVTPNPAQVLTEYISLLFHSTLSTATGEVGMKIVHEVSGAGGHFLVIEGSIPSRMPEACKMGHEPMNDLIEKAAEKCAAVVAVGACATFGGIPSAENNMTGAMGVSDYFKFRNISKPIINIPGCPMHPDWLVGTLAHVISFGMPELDDLGRPKMFFGRVIHDLCPRRADFENGNFAKTFGDPGCLYELGCQGPDTHADCTVRFWNNRTNTCIVAGSPCIGCAAEFFAKERDKAFYRKN